jgi:hypothetical protein
LPHFSSLNHELENAAYLSARGFDVAIEPAISWRLMRLQIARETGWTLEYIDAMDLEAIGDFAALWSGVALAQKADNGRNS